MNKYSKKIVFTVVFSIVILFVSLMNVNAVTITETVENDEYSTIANNTTIIGITKFESGKIITAGNASEATYNDMVFNYDNYGYFEMPKIYNYLEGKWYEIDENNGATPVTDEDLIEDLNNQDIYYINNEEKLIDMEYNPDVEDGYQLVFYTEDSVKDELIKYENGILSIPATVTRVYVDVQEIETGYSYTIDTIQKEYLSDTEYYSTTAWVSTLDELKAALVDDKIYTIKLDADITGIDETLKVQNYKDIDGKGYKLQFDELAEDTSGLLIATDNIIIDNLTIELTAKEGWQGNYGIEVYNSIAVDIYNTTVSNADTGILVNGSGLEVNATTLNDNEFGGIGVGQSSELENNSVLTVGSWLEINNENSRCPAIWVEDNQGSVTFGEDVEELVSNTEIPTALGKTQTFYYVDETVVEKIDVSNLTELKNALTLENVTEVTLTESFTTDETLEVNHTMTINGNGETITAAENKNLFHVTGTDTVLTINNAKLVTSGSGTAVKVGDKNLEEGKYLKAVIGEDVEITSYWYGVTVYGENSTVDLYGDINIEGNGYGIAGNGSENCGNTTINVKEGATISAPNGYALYIPQDGIVNIEGGELTGASVVAIKAGTLNITGGTLTATGEKLDPVPASYNGKAATGDVIAVEVNQKYVGGQSDKNIKINIEDDAILESKNAYIIRELNADSSDIEIEVTGKYDEKISLDTDVNIYSNIKPEVSNVSQLKAVLTNPNVTEVTLAESFTAEETLEVNHTMTINGNGETITSAENSNLFHVTGTDTTLTINNAKLVTSGSGTAVKVGDKNLEEGKYLKAIIGEDVEITSYWYGVTVYGENSTVDLYGDINIEGNGYGIAGNGSANCGNTTINVKEGATISAPNGYALYIPQDGIVNIEGGELTGASVVAIKAGTLNITGGILTATGEKLDPVPASYNGKAATGDVIAVEVNDSYDGGKTDKNINVNITGGTLTSENAYIIRELNADSSDIEIVVTGLYPLKKNIDKDVDIYISDKIAEVGGELYTLQEAMEVAATGSDNTIILTEDLPTNVQYTVPSLSNIILDLNGKKITSSYEGYALVTEGKITIKDSSGTNSGEIVGNIGVKYTENLVIESGKYTGNIEPIGFDSLNNTLNITGGLFSQNIGPLLKDGTKNVIKNSDGYYEFFDVTSREKLVQLLNSWAVVTYDEGSSSNTTGDSQTVRTIVFEDDLWLSLSDFTPITNEDLDDTEQGKLIIDGNGKFVSGINGAASLFALGGNGTVATSANGTLHGTNKTTTIKNLTVKDSEFVGAYAAAVNSANQNVNTLNKSSQYVIYDNITVLQVNVTGSKYSAGIAAYDGSFNNCTVKDSTITNTRTDGVGHSGTVAGLVNGGGTNAVNATIENVDLITTNDASRTGAFIGTLQDGTALSGSIKDVSINGTAVTTEDSYVGTGDDKVNSSNVTILE